MRFLGLRFRLFQIGNKMWVPLADLANGLGYESPQMLYKLAREHPKLFKEQGWLLDGKEGIGNTEIVFPGNTISASGNTRPMTLFTTYEGVMMCLMLNRSEKADEFKIWAAKRLVPAMVRRMHKQTPLDDLTPKQRLEWMRETRRLKRKEVQRKLLTSPMYFCDKLLKEMHETAKTVQNSAAPSEVKAGYAGYFEELREIIYDIQERLKGPTLFSK